jgi:hypothetical protein
MTDFYTIKRDTLRIIQEYLAQTEPDKREFKALCFEVLKRTGMGSKFILNVLDNYHLKVNSKGLIESEI